MSGWYMRRSVEGSDYVENEFSQAYIKIIKKSIWFSKFTIIKKRGNAQNMIHKKREHKIMINKTNYKCVIY